MNSSHLPLFIAVFIKETISPQGSSPFLSLVLYLSAYTTSSKTPHSKGERWRKEIQALQAGQEVPFFKGLHKEYQLTQVVIEHVLDFTQLAPITSIKVSEAWLSIRLRRVSAPAAYQQQYPYGYDHLRAAHMRYP